MTIRSKFSLTAILCMAAAVAIRAAIEALEQQAYRPGSSEPDKAGGHDHLNDATGYFMYARYAHKPSFRTDIGHMGR